MRSAADQIANRRERARPPVLGGLADGIPQRETEPDTPVALLQTLGNREHADRLAVTLGRRERWRRRRTILVRPGADVVGLLVGFRGVGVLGGATAVVPETLQTVECRRAIAQPPGEETADHQPGAADTGAAVDVDTVAGIQRLVDLIEDLDGPRSTARHAVIDDRSAGVIDRAAGQRIVGIWQQRFVGLALAGLGQVDEVVDAHAAQRLEASDRGLDVLSGGVRTGQQPAWHDPVTAARRRRRHASWIRGERPPVASIGSSVPSSSPSSAPSSSPSSS